MGVDTLAEEAGSAGSGGVGVELSVVVEVEEAVLEVEEVVVEGEEVAEVAVEVVVGVEVEVVEVGVFVVEQKKRKFEACLNGQRDMDDERERIEVEAKTELFTNKDRARQLAPSMLK